MKKDKKEKPVTPETPGLDQDIDDGAMDAEVVSEAGVEEQTAEASVAEWQAALELAVKQRDELKDQFLRAQADFQNFKRRNQTARSDGYDDGVREVIAAMLPAIDNLERAIDAAEKHEGGKVTLPEGKVIPAQEGWDGTSQIEDLRRATSAMADAHESASRLDRTPSCASITCASDTIPKPLPAETSMSTSQNSSVRAARRAPGLRAPLATTLSCSPSTESMVRMRSCSPSLVLSSTIARRRIVLLPGKAILPRRNPADGSRFCHVAIEAEP